MNIIFGLIFCFCGYRIFKFMLGLLGFLVGGLLAGAFVLQLTQNELLGVLAGLLGGVLGAVLMVALFYVGVFLIGALFGCIAGAAICSCANSEPEPVLLVILAIVGGIVALYLQKFMIIVSTAFSGSASVVSGIYHFTSKEVRFSTPEQYFESMVNQKCGFYICVILLAIVGVIVQYATTQKKEVNTEAHAKEPQQQASLQNADAQ